MEKIKKYNYVVVGAGLSAAVFCNEAKKAGKLCLVIERRNHIGGNCHQVTKHGICVHVYGAHIFRTDNVDIWNYLNDFVPMVGFVNTPIGIYHGKAYNLPINMNSFNELWGTVAPADAMRKIEEQRIPCENPQNLEEWALSVVGRDVYNTFIREYSEKQWGLACSALPQSVMRRIPIRFTYDNNYYSQAHQGVPATSYDDAISKMLDGADVALGVKFNMALHGGMATDGIIYTGALDELFDFRLGTLGWRGLKFAHNVLDEENYQGVAVVNHLDKSVPYTRTIEHKHFLKQKSSKTIVTEEYPVSWSVGDEPYYPLEDVENKRLADAYKKLASQNGIVPLGRLGEYKYFSMDEAIENSLNVARRVLYG